MASSDECTPPPEGHDMLPLLKTRHIKFLHRLLQVLPEATSSQETSRMTIAYFSISGLDILGALDSLDQTNKTNIINWIYNLQVPRSDDDPLLRKNGFRGSCFLKLQNHQSCDPAKGCGALKANSGHVAMTYTALASLVILGDDLSRIDKKAITSGLSCLQQEDGSFVASAEEAENDMRFIYCAVAVSYMLNDWSGINIQKATEFIIRSLRYDGGFAQCPGMESHGGSTYCALAALSLMGTLKLLTQNQIDQILRWCILRLNVGFQGRPNKPDDTCYSFWVGGAISILCPAMWTKELILKSGRFVFSTQDPIVGGLSKWPDQSPDPLHTYLGLAGLSLSHSVEGLQPVHPALNISERAVEHLKRLHQTKLNQS